MSTAANKELVVRYFDELWNHRNPAIMNELRAPNRDIAPAREYLSQFYAQWGDTEMTPLHLVAEDDWVVMHYRATGTHQGAYFGAAPTGRRVTAEGLVMCRIADGKIVEDFGWMDLIPVLQQVGALPTPVEAG